MGMLATMAMWASLAGGMAGPIAHVQPAVVVRLGHNRIDLPFRAGPTPLTTDITEAEQVAQNAVGGGMVEGVTASVWAGKPVWLVTVRHLGQDWHVMVNPVSYRTESQMPVTR